ncbi:MAG: hypothetical protein HKN23_18810, partial [Verrucomicrobiales bacterium]|nr:hypothetical protein [Verrucomicrobiales bacterium]
IQGMVDYSRDDSINLIVGDPNALVERAIKFVHFDLTNDSVSLYRDLRPDLPKVLMDHTKMEQVIINLITNGIHAMKGQENPKIEISTHWGTVDHVDRDEGIRDSKHIRNNDEVIVIEVRDHGPGIPPDKLDRVFEPFYTTKPTGEGTGLGLSVVKRIIDLHRGRIELENGPQDDSGLRVRIYLKAHNALLKK